MDPGNMGPLGEWLPEAIWPRLKSLERIKRFHNIGDAMQSDSDDWQVSQSLNRESGPWSPSSRRTVQHVYCCEYFGQNL